MIPYKVILFFATPDGEELERLSVSLLCIPGLGETIDLSSVLFWTAGLKEQYKDTVWVVKDIRHSIRTKVDTRGANKQGVGLWLEPRG